MSGDAVNAPTVEPLHRLPRQSVHSQWRRRGPPRFLSTSTMESGLVFSISAHTGTDALEASTRSFSRGGRANGSENKPPRRSHLVFPPQLFLLRHFSSWPLNTHLKRTIPVPRPLSLLPSSREAFTMARVRPERVRAVAPFAADQSQQVITRACPATRSERPWHALGLQRRDKP